MDNQENKIRNPSLSIIKSWHRWQRVGANSIYKTAELFSALKQAGVKLRTLNLGGGFPAQYSTAVLCIKTYIDAIVKAMNRYFDTTFR